MKTLGTFLQSARKAQHVSVEELESKTRIRKEFIVALETEKWSTLPEYPVVVGFVKSIAKTLDCDEIHAVALLRRDYPPKDLPVNPKPDVFTSFVWSPKLTFISGMVLVVGGVLVYLFLQYRSFVKPPILEITNPQDGQVVTEETLTVTGITDPEATIRVNNQPVLVSEDGSFSATIEVFEGTREIVVKSISRSGDESQVSRTIEPDLE